MTTTSAPDERPSVAMNDQAYGALRASAAVWVGTSVLMALRPDLVNMDLAVKEVPPPKWALAPDLKQLARFRQLSQSGVLGDPLRSSAQKGEEMLKKAVAELTQFVSNFKRMEAASHQPVQPTN